MRFSMLSAAVFGVVALLSVATHVDASLAGFALACSATISFDVRFPRHRLTRF